MGAVLRAAVDLFDVLINRFGHGIGKVLVHLQSQLEIPLNIMFVFTLENEKVEFYHITCLNTIQ